MPRQVDPAALEPALAAAASLGLSVPPLPALPTGAWGGGPGNGGVRTLVDGTEAETCLAVVVGAGAAGLATAAALAERGAGAVVVLEARDEVLPPPFLSPRSSLGLSARPP